MNRSLRSFVVFAAFVTAALAAPASALARASDGPVVRPQKFGTGNKFEVSALVGYVSNDPYNRIIVPGAAITYHFSEHSAIDVHAGYALYSPKQLLSQVRQKIGRDPDVVSRPQFFVTANYMWTPVYGKLSAFGEVVLHYDLYLVGGLGITSDEIETNSSASPSQKTISTQIFPVTDVGIGQHFFLSRKTAIRVEFRPYTFWEQIDNKWDPNGDVQIIGGLSYIF